MGLSFGRGLLGSLRAQVKHDLRSLAHDNRTLREARYSAPRRWVGNLITNRTISQVLVLYAVVLLAALLAEWAGNRY